MLANGFLCYDFLPQVSSKDRVEERIEENLKMIENNFKAKLVPEENIQVTVQLVAVHHITLHV